MNTLQRLLIGVLGLGQGLAGVACVAEPEPASSDHASPARTAEPDALAGMREREEVGASERRQPLAPLEPDARARLWSSPEDPPAAELGGATEELVGQQYLTGNEHHLEVFAERLGADRGGAYLGVGADQAYLLIAWADPELAWLADYDPEVVAVHRIHLAFLRAAETPTGFLELWSREGRRRALDLIAEDPHPSLGDAGERERLAALYERSLRMIHNRLEELAAIEANTGVSTYLSDQALYDRVHRLALGDRMRPIVADLRGELGLAGVAATAGELGVELRVLYLSNAEEYWEDYGQQYRANIDALPWAEDAVVLRTLLTWSRNRDYAYNTQAIANYREWLARPWVHFVYQVVHRPVKPDLSEGELDAFETARDPSESPADRRWRRRTSG